MKKSILFLGVIVFLFISNIGIAQNLLKIGPSVLVNYSSFHEETYVPIGVELAYELAVLNKLSINVAGSYHFGKFENPWTSNRVLGNELEDQIFALQADLRYHFKERYKGAYIGVGGDIKSLVSKFALQTTIGDPTATIEDIERNFGLSLGSYFTLGSGVINPALYLGFDPSDVNEYPIHTKVGLNYGF